MMSAGVALYPDHASDASGLLRAADAAMYRASAPAARGNWRKESRGRRGPSFHAAGEAAAVGWRSARDARAIEGVNDEQHVSGGHWAHVRRQCAAFVHAAGRLHDAAASSWIDADAGHRAQVGWPGNPAGFEFGSTGPILFDFDRYNLKPDVRRIVERIGRTPTRRDQRGTGRLFDQEGVDKYDVELSRRRAEVVALNWSTWGSMRSASRSSGKGRAIRSGTTRRREAGRRTGGRRSWCRRGDRGGFSVRKERRLKAAEDM